jgi:hypothetical protein
LPRDIEDRGADKRGMAEVQLRHCSQVPQGVRQRTGYHYRARSSLWRLEYVVHKGRDRAREIVVAHVIDPHLIHDVLHVCRYDITRQIVCIQVSFRTVPGSK